MTSRELRAFRDLVVGVVSALVLTGFVLLPAGPAAPLDVLLVAPASMTTVHAPADAWVTSAVWAAGEDGLSGDRVSPEDTADTWAVDGWSPDDSWGDDWLNDFRGGWRPRPASTTLSAPTQLRLAYWKAARAMPSTCNLKPEFLAAIGQVESGNLGGRSVGADHVVRPPVYGPPLTGGPYANIPDTDGGRWDGSSAYDRAVGPMQFIPSTWATSGRDGDSDGIADPQNVYDAALSAAGYLCAGGRDLATAEGVRAALWSYNQSVEYAALVLQWYARFLDQGLGGLADDAQVIATPVARTLAASTSTAATTSTASASGSGITSPSASPSRSSSAASTAGTPSASSSAPAAPCAPASGSASASSAVSTSGAGSTAPSPTPSSTSSPSTSTSSPVATPSSTTSSTATPTGAASGSTTPCPGASATASPSVSASPSLTTSVGSASPTASAPSSQASASSASSGIASGAASSASTSASTSESAPGPSTTDPAGVTGGATLSSDPTQPAPQQTVGP